MTTLALFILFIWLIAFVSAPLLTLIGTAFFVVVGCLLMSSGGGDFGRR